MTKSIAPLSMNKANHSSRGSLLLLITVFVLPLLLAKLALDNQWLKLGVTNQGKLLSQSLTLEDLGLKQPAFAQQWLIMYRLPEICPQLCLHNIETVHNSYVALGKDMPRVAALLINNNIFSAQQYQQLAKSQWHLVPLTPKITTLLPAPQVLIADPLGNIILQYQLPQEVAQQNDFSKAIIADMKKLLKYSKVG